jgi:hypothetical protein
MHSMPGITIITHILCCYFIELAEQSSFTMIDFFLDNDTDDKDEKR